MTGLVQIPLDLTNTTPNHLCNIGGKYQLKFTTSCYDPVDCSAGVWQDLLVDFEVASLSVCGATEINFADKISVEYEAASKKVNVGTPATFVTTIRAPPGLLAGARLIGYSLDGTSTQDTSLVRLKNGEPILTELGEKTALKAPVSYNATFNEDKDGVEVAQFNITFYATAGSKSSIIPPESVTTGGEFGTRAQFQLFMRKISQEDANGSISGGPLRKRAVTSPIYLNQVDVQKIATRAATIAYVDPETNSPWMPTQQVDSASTTTGLAVWQAAVIAVVACAALAGIGAGTAIAIKKKRSSSTTDVEMFPNVSSSVETLTQSLPRPPRSSAETQPRQSADKPTRTPSFDATLVKPAQDYFSMDSTSSSPTTPMTPYSTLSRSYVPPQGNSLPQTPGTPSMPGTLILSPPGSTVTKFTRSAQVFDFNASPPSRR